MAYKVQVMTDLEAQRHEKFRKEQDECCDTVKLCIGWSIFVLLFLYFIILIIVAATLDVIYLRGGKADDISNNME